MTSDNGVSEKEYDYTLIDIVDDSNYGVLDPMQKEREKHLHKELINIRVDIDDLRSDIDSL